MSYQLYIEVEGSWRLADIGDDKPALNFQVNEISSLSSLNSNYSQALKLPKTPTNRLIFANSDAMDTTSYSPYEKRNCRLFSNNYAIAGAGSYLILIRVSKYFEVQILSKTIDFLTLLEKPLKSLDLGSIIRDYNSVNPINFNTKYCFAAATFIKGGAPVYQPDLENVFPFVNYKKAIETLVTSKGFTLKTNLTNEQWENLWLSLSDVKSDFPEYTGAASFQGAVVGGVYPLVIDNNASGKFTNPVPLTYQAAFGCKINIIANVNSSVSTEIAIILDVAGVQTSLYYSISTTHDINLTADVAAAGKIKITIIASGSGTAKADIKLEMVPDFVQSGEKLPFSYNLGFATQADFFKAFLQLFGMTLIVDDEHKIVNCFSMQALYDNKSIAKDWSKKLVIKDDDELSFTLGNYGQKNYIRFTDNPDDNKIDSGFFTINNESLVESKDLFTLPFQAGLDNYVSEKLVANIPLEEITDTDINFKGCPPHLVELSTDTVTFRIGIGTDWLYKRTIHVSAQRFVRLHYAKLEQMLGLAKYIDVLMDLTDYDIENYDPFIPIYLSRFGFYFYINKIVNYVSGQLTKVQLIKL